MNNEIKEINLSEMLFNRDERLLDCITNLQQKEELLRQEISDVRKAFNGLQQEKDDLYLDNTMLKMENDIYKQGYEDLKDLLNTLQNGDDSQ